MREILILTPVYNDWDSLCLLLEELEKALSGDDLTAQVVVLDDGSELPPPVYLSDRSFEALTSLRIVHLRRNLGHQRAIAVGLCCVQAAKAEAVVVMDSDGEDAPADVLRLVRAHREAGEATIIFGSRVQRSEGIAFRLCYSLYRLFFRLITGQSIRFGNFCLIPAALLPRIIILSEIWNHFSAGILKARIPYIELPCARGKRLAGASRMDFISLITHGLSAVAVYGDVIGTRALLGTFVLTCGSIFAAVAAIWIRLTTNLAVPGWATYVVGLVLIILIQCVTLSFFYLFLVLVGRSGTGTIPLREYEYFILNTTLYMPALPAAGEWRIRVAPAGR